MIETAFFCPGPLERLTGNKREGEVSEIRKFCSFRPSYCDILPAPSLRPSHLSETPIIRATYASWTPFRLAAIVDGTVTNVVYVVV